MLKTKVELKAQVDAVIVINGNREITPPLDNSIRTNFINSFVGMVGDEIISGEKTFSADIIIPTEVYGVAWNNSFEAATKDSIYDKIESVIASIPASSYDDTPVFYHNGSRDMTGSVNFADINEGITWASGSSILEEAGVLQITAIDMIGDLNMNGIFDIINADEISGTELKINYASGSIHDSSDFFIIDKDRRLYASNGDSVLDFSSFSNGVVIRGEGFNFASLKTANLTALRTFQFPDNSGTFALVSDIASKEDAITVGTNLQYWRGDKTFQTLNTSVVPEVTNLYYTQGRFDNAFGLKSTTDLLEGANLYYTNAKVRATDLAGLSIAGSSLIASDTVLQAFGKLQNQINGVLAGGLTQAQVRNITLLGI